MAEQRQSTGKNKNLRRILLVVIGLVVSVITICITRWILQLRDPDTMEWFRAVLEKMGPLGWLVLLGIQYIQIVIAFVPGGPVQIVAGLLYGPILGTLICFSGTILAASTVFWLVSRYGHNVVTLFVEEKNLRTYRFLQNDKRIERLVLILFLIPGTPKDALTYMFALTPLKMSRFMLISTAARMPAVLTSVLAGDSITNGEWMQAGVLFVVICLLGATGLLLHKKILAVSGRKSD